MKTPHLSLTLSVATLFLGAIGYSVAQQLNPPPVGQATPAPVLPRAPALPAEPPGTPSAAPAATTPVEVITPAPAPPSPTPAAPAPRPATAETPAPTSAGIMLNFQGAALKDVLNYLSDAAGFVIVQDTPVTGTVNIVSRQPIGTEDAVDLLNTVLAEKGYAAIRNGRILKIVKRGDAVKRDLPVQMGSDPAKIPRNDSIVTQILPLRFGEAAKVIANLQPLLSETANVSANEASNAIIMTDTQTNIRRIAQILKALDTSVSSISTLTVFPLQYADAKAVADSITQLFPPAQPTGPGQGGRGGGGGGGPGGRFAAFFGGGAGGANAGGAGQSEARLAAARVLAVADELSNSVIVSAPESEVPTIRELILQLDVSTTDVTQTKIYRITHADALELADIISNLFSDSANQRSTNRGGQGNNNNRGGQGGQGGQRGANNTGGTSQRLLMQARVVAVGDPRTNTLVVTAAADTLQQIDEIVKRLDATEDKRQRVYVHSLQHADADNVAKVLRGMLGDTSVAGSSGQSVSSRLDQRLTNGASVDTTTSSNSGLGSNSNRR